MVVLGRQQNDKTRPPRRWPPCGVFDAEPVRVETDGLLCRQRRTRWRCGTERGVEGVVGKQIDLVDAQRAAHVSIEAARRGATQPPTISDGDMPSARPSSSARVSACSAVGSCRLSGRAAASPSAANASARSAVANHGPLLSRRRAASRRGGRLRPVRANLSHLADGRVEARGLAVE